MRRPPCHGRYDSYHMWTLRRGFGVYFFPTGAENFKFIFLWINSAVHCIGIGSGGW